MPPPDHAPAAVDAPPTELPTGMPAGGDARPPADAARLEPVQELGDFTATPRVIWITALAVAIGAVSACIALALLRLIGRLALPGRNKRPAA